MSDLKFEDLNFFTDSELLGHRVEDKVVHLRCRMTFDNWEEISIIKGAVSHNLWEVYSRFCLDDKGNLKTWHDKAQDKLRSTHDIVRFDTEDELMEFLNKIRNYKGSKPPLNLGKVTKQYNIITPKDINKRYTKKWILASHLSIAEDDIKKDEQVDCFYHGLNRKFFVLTHLENINFGFKEDEYVEIGEFIIVEAL